MTVVLAKQKALKSALFATRSKGQYVAKLHASLMGKNYKMMTTAKTGSRKLDYNDEMDISESDAYDLKEDSEVEGSEVD